MTTAVTPAHKAGLYIGVSCPGCGGELELGADFFVLTCPHCASVLRIVMPDTPPAYLVKSRKPRAELRFSVDRYCRENGLPLTTSSLQIKALYYPYWKVDAVVLKLRTTTYEVSRDDEEQYSEEQTEERSRTDINLAPYLATLPAGYNDESIPVSLGLRADYIRMIPFSTENVETDFDYPPVTRAWGDALKGLDAIVSRMDRLSSIGAGAHATKLFRPAGSIIYFPYYMLESYSASGTRRFVVDGVTGKVMSHAIITETAENPESISSVAVELGKLDVVLHRCANCGENLPESKSFVYYCRNCGRLDFLETAPLLHTEIVSSSPHTKLKDTMCPFWALHVAPEDEKRIRPMLGGIYESDRFLIPAFKIRNFEAMYRLSKRMSAVYPRLTWTGISELNQEHHPVTLGFTEALTLAEVVLSREQSNRAMRLTDESFEFRPLEAQLCYVPFHADDYFMIDSVVEAVTFEKGLLA